MAEITSGLSSYQWTDYDKKINTSENKTAQQGALKEALKDDKLTGTEIKGLKEKYQASFKQENPDATSETADTSFYSSLSSVTGIMESKLRSADSSPVEFSFNIQNDKIDSITEDANEDGDSDAVTTKEGGAEAAVVASDTQTPEGLKFKDYKNNNFDDAAKVPQNKENFSKGSVALIKEAKVIEAIGGEPETSAKETIQHFQSSIGLTDKDVDGKFGPKTMSALAEKYTTALNTNPPNENSKAEMTRLGAVIDKLQPMFESTKVGDDLKLLRSATSSSDKVETAKKVMTDKREIIKVAGEFVVKGSEALKKSPADFEGFKKVYDDVKASNLPPAAKDKVISQLEKLAENKLTANIGSPPAKNLTSTELIDSLPDNNETKAAFKAMYSSEVKNGKTNWTLRQPADIGESLKGSPPEVVAKTLTSLGAKDSETILKKMEPHQAKATVDAMKPADAAKIFDKMNAREAMPILTADGQDKTKTAAIIAEMQPNNAKKLLENTAKTYTAWTNAVKGQLNEDKAAKALEGAITFSGTKYGTEHLDKINESSSPKSQATKEAFILLHDKSEKDGKITWTPKTQTDKAKLNEFMQKPEFKQLSSEVQQFIANQSKSVNPSPVVAADVSKSNNSKTQNLINAFAGSFIPNPANMKEGGNADMARVAIDNATKNLSKEQLLELKSQLASIPDTNTIGGGADGAKKSISESVNKRLAELDKKPSDLPSSLKDMREKFESFFTLAGDEALENKAKESMQSAVVNLSNDDLVKMKKELAESGQSRGTVGFKNNLTEMIEKELMVRNL